MVKNNLSNLTDEKKTVAIILLNFNGDKDTIACLRSISNLEKESIKTQVIVVDNGSEKPFTIGELPFSIKNVHIINNKNNLGFSGGNNVGIKYALDNNFDYIVILNNDTFLDKNTIKNLVNSAESDDSIGIVAPKIYFAKGQEFHKDRYKEEEKGKVIWYAGGIMDWKNVIGSHRGVDQVDNGQFNKLEETDFASGCCMLIKKEVLKKIGLFDEKYFLYYEDNDISKRVKDVGYKIIYAPHTFLWHNNAGSTGGSGSKLQDYYITRNRMFFGMRYAPFRSKLALIKESISLLIRGRKWQKIGIRDFYFQRFGKGSYKV